MGVKKNILLGWLAFEALGLCIGLPVAAQIHRENPKPTRSQSRQPGNVM